MAEKPRPFTIRSKKRGMYTVLLNADILKDETVEDVKKALEIQYQVPTSESCMLAEDGSRVGDQEELKKFLKAWLVLIHTKAHTKRVDADAKTGNKEAKEADSKERDEQSVDEDRQEEGEELVNLEFFYQGRQLCFDLPLTASISQVIKDILAPGFGVKHHERLGIYLESQLLPGPTIIYDVKRELTSAAIVPLVHDLVTTRARDQPLPVDAFKTDCATCKTTGVMCKLRPFCSVCGEGTITKVSPSMQNMGNNLQQYTWRDIESLTGRCENPNCESYLTFVDVYFHCFCQGDTDRGKQCISRTRREPLASYTGGRVEQLLESLYHNQYFVRMAPAE